ncbi:MAG: 30S ribosomal protein S12 methylthiotransferase RimO [Oscillospiraceae bacterium]|nr:30S ribosomal protein S12 methylthiotransferase RimO [Oscillospiraceae bacterium]
MSYKIGMVSLGCSKNQVDAEMMLSSLSLSGYEITPNESEADVIIVNTCGFIEEAKREAIENIIEAANYKKEGNLKALIVTGCLAERYRDQIMSEIPEIDAVVGIGKNSDIAKIVSDSLGGSKQCAFDDKVKLDINADRILSTPSYMAYLKIAEGCDNCCTYCAIPAIRGRYRSRTIESIVAEAKKLSDRGVKELVLIAQDPTRYGEDLYGKSELVTLLTELCKIEGLHWIRTLYTYPERITDELLDVVASNDKLVKYFDIPLQHCDAKILKHMNRQGNRAELTTLINKIRTKIPDVTIRTTFLTGFPGETEQEFEELCEFVKEIRFDRVGCFAYSAEEGTPAAEFPNQVEDQIKYDRAENIMNEQSIISAQKNEEKIGTTIEVLVEGYDDYIKCYFGRSAADAPEVDGKVFFMSPVPLVIGDFVMVQINDTLEYDLLGEIVEE